MPQKTIYVKEEDLELYEKANQLYEDRSLSETIVDALATYIQFKKGIRGNFSIQSLAVGKWPREGTPDLYVRFAGFPLDSASTEKEDNSVHFTLHQGVNGRFLLYREIIYERAPDGHAEQWEADYVEADDLPKIKKEAGKEGWEVPADLWERVEKKLDKRIIEHISL